MSSSSSLSSSVTSARDDSNANGIFILERDFSPALARARVLTTRRFSSEFIEEIIDDDAAAAAIAVGRNGLHPVHILYAKCFRTHNVNTSIVNAARVAVNLVT